MKNKGDKRNRDDGSLLANWNVENRRKRWVIICIVNMSELICILNKLVWFVECKLRYYFLPRELWIHISKCVECLNYTILTDMLSSH